MAASTVTQGLEDLTGGIGYKFDWRSRSTPIDPTEGEYPEKLWQEMMEKMKTNHVIGCQNDKGSRGRRRRQGDPPQSRKVVTGGEFEQNC